MSKTSKANHQQQLVASIRARAEAALRAQRAAGLAWAASMQQQEGWERDYYYALHVANRNRQWIILEKLFGTELLEGLQMAASVFSFDPDGESDLYFTFTYGGEWRLRLYPDRRHIEYTLPNNEACFGYNYDDHYVQTELLILLAEWDEEHALEVAHVS